LPAKKTTWAWLTGTFFGIGLVGRGGGTLASIPVVLAWIFLEHHHPATFDPYWATFAVAATAIGIPASTIVSRQSGLKDPSQVIIDEVSGQSIALLFAPILNWKYALASFILFRAFDIVKPPPVRQLERLPEGWGIMMDDVAAGVLALILLQIAAHFHLFG
jgi:phosphatidylglycerophosphatase A